MTKRIVLLVAAALFVAAGFAGCNGAQTKPNCLVGHGGYALKYIARPGGTCPAKQAEIAGFSPYYNEDGTRQELVAIKPATLTLFEDTPNVGLDPANPIVATGKLTDIVPDQDNFCYVPTMAAAEQHLPGDPGDPDAGVDPTEAVDISYAFSDVKFYVTPSAPGTQMSATLDYGEDGCTSQYDVIGVYPAVFCGVLDPDTFEPVLDDAGVPLTDESKCAIYNDFGRTLNPAFPVRCEPRSQLCLLQGDRIPNLQSVK